MNKFLRRWILIVVGITLILGCIYTFFQHKIRSSVTNMLLPMSDNAAYQLSQSKPLSDVIPQFHFDLNDSQYDYTFMMVFNKNGEVASSSALLDGQIPQLPKGVLDYTDSKGIDKITWEPKSGVREAIVVRPFESTNNQGFVLAGYPLMLAEERTRMLTHATMLLWVILVTLSSYPLLKMMMKEKMPAKKATKKSKK